MSVERIRKRNRLLREKGQLPGAIPVGEVLGAPSQVVRPLASGRIKTRGNLHPLPCIHEGAVLEYCKIRQGQLAEVRHVRDCDIHERCTRGYVGPRVQACGDCPDYKAEGTESPPPEQSIKSCNPLLKITPLPASPIETPSSIPLVEITDSLPENQKREKRWKKPPVWMYGVTTATFIHEASNDIRKPDERRKTKLPHTLQSLVNAGFPRPTLFVDGDWDYKSWEGEFHLPCVMRYPRIRVYGNWVLSLAEMYIRNAHADYYAIFQDDFIVSKNLKSYIEAIQYPEKGYLNLYTFPKNQTLANGRVGFYPSNQKGKGAVALIFNKEAVQVLLAHNHMVKRVQDMIRGHKFVDGSIVETMKQAGWKEYVHNPSLVQHTGEKSTTGNPRHPQATSFRGENYDLMDLLKGT